MPGVFRPYTLVDVLGTINEQLTAPTGDTIDGFGTFAETDEAMTVNDSMITTVQANTTYDTGIWGEFTWG